MDKKNGVEPKETQKEDVPAAEATEPAEAVAAE